MLSKYEGVDACYDVLAFFLSQIRYVENACLCNGHCIIKRRDMVGMKEGKSDKSAVEAFELDLLTYLICC